MREIKFRIFDGNEYWYSGGMPMMLAGFFRQTARFHTRLGYPYEQFTGWRDNGKEIYENDMYIDSWKTVNVITWDIKDEVMTVGYGQSEREIKSGFVIEFVPQSNFEIIGNKYETPGLFDD